MCAAQPRFARRPSSNQIETEITGDEPNELYPIRSEIARRSGYDDHSFFCLDKREDRLHGIRLVFNPGRKALSPAGSNDHVEDTRRSLPMKKYESLIGEVCKPNLFLLQFS